MARRAVLGGVGLWLGSVSGLADGKFFPPAAFPASVEIPDQRALVHFSNGVERLVIETRFTTAATNLAWVVPLPASPTIEPASTGLFPTLEFLFRPEIVHRSKGAYWLPLFLGGVGFLVLTVRPTGRLTISDALACLVVAAGAGHSLGSALGGAFVFGPFLLGIVHSLRSHRAYLVLVILVLMVLAVGFLLPDLARTKAGGTQSVAGVDILDRRVVGAYDTTTVTASDPQALQSWLMTNGFTAPTNTHAAIEAYVQQGWVFVAAKVRGDQAVSTNSIHPLGFTFQTPRAVYPMRLTGVGTESLDLELYVFGEQRAEAPHFKVDHCTRLAYPKPAEGWRGREPALPILHPGLRGCVQGAPVATKLTAKLTGPGLNEDVWIDWVPFVPHRTVLYTNRVVLDEALGRVGWPTVVLALAGTAWGRWGPSRLRRHGLLTVVAAMLVLAAYALHVWTDLPRTEVRLAMRPSISTKHTAYELSFALEDMTPPDNASLEAARRALREHLASTNSLGRLISYRTNQWLGGLVREEDSPGNYRLQQGTAGIELLWYDEWGAENRLAP